MSALTLLNVTAGNKLFLCSADLAGAVNRAVPRICQWIMMPGTKQDGRSLSRGLWTVAHLPQKISALLGSSLCTGVPEEALCLWRPTGPHNSCQRWREQNAGVRTHWQTSANSDADKEALSPAPAVTSQSPTVATVLGAGLACAIGVMVLVAVLAIYMRTRTHKSSKGTAAS